MFICPTVWPLRKRFATLKLSYLETLSRKTFGRFNFFKTERR